MHLKQHSGKHYSVYELTGYGILGLPLALMGLPLVVFLPALYAGLPQLSTAIVGMLLLIARLFDVITDPVIGWASDRTRTIYGRRIPWLFAGTPVLIVSTWFLFNPHVEAGAGWLLGWSLLAYLGWTMVYLPYVALGAELSNDYNERTRITVFREGFFVLGTLIAITLPSFYISSNSSSATTLLPLSVFLLISLPVALLLLVSQVKDQPCKPLVKHDWRNGIQLIKNNNAFRRLLIAYLLNGAANGLPAALFVFFTTYVLKINEQIAGALLITYFMSAIISLPLWMKLGAKISKHRLWCISMIWACAVFIWVPFLDEGNLFWFFVICMLTGLCLGIDQAIPASMQADVIDLDTAVNGSRRAGIFFGLWGMATKMAFALAVGLAYPLLDIAGFEPGQSNSTESLLVLAMLYGGLPVVIKLCVVTIMWNYPLGREQHENLQYQLL